MPMSNYAGRAEVKYNEDVYLITEQQLHEFYSVSKHKLADYELTKTVTMGFRKVSFVSMTVADLRTYEKISESERIYFDALEECEFKLEQEKKDKELDRIIALGIGFIVGYLVAQ